MLFGKQSWNTHLISQHCKFFLYYCSNHQLYIFSLIRPEHRLLEVYFIRIFKYLSGSHIMFLHWIYKTWSHKNSSLVCAGEIAESLTCTHLDVVISLYKVTNRGSCISASCSVFNAVAAFWCLPIFDNADCWEIYKEVTGSRQIVSPSYLPHPHPSPLESIVCQCNLGKTGCTCPECRS